MSTRPGITPAELAEWRRTPVPMALMPMVLRLLDAAEAHGRLRERLRGLAEKWQRSTPDEVVFGPHGNLGMVTQRACAGELERILEDRNHG
jgi:hypothetical protein